MTYTFNTFLDASALISWVLYPDVKQPGGENLHAVLDQPGCSPYTSELCLTETLSRFKWMRFHKEITSAGYSMRTWLLHTRIRHGSLKISSFEYWEKKYFEKAITMVEDNDYKIDVIDALQILDVTEGNFTFFAGPSKTVLATCDSNLRKVAHKHGVRVWFPTKEAEPPPMDNKSGQLTRAQ
ncbi:MAG: hypothetical protein KDD53_06600 [Bdellovibrionales bacterium]|nr:hypothetical protein [Bdellovibrionales bacterium]